MTRNQTRSMTKRRFMRLLGAYGASPSHWPEGEREAARLYLDRHGTPSALAQERHVDRILDAGDMPLRPASDALMDRLLAVPHMSRALATAPANIAKIGPGILLHILSPVAFPARAAALAIALAAGLWIGTTGVSSPTDEAMDLSPWLMGYDLAFYRETPP